MFSKPIALARRHPRFLAQAVLATAALVVLAPCLGRAQATELSGKEIMRLSDRAQRSDTEYSVMTMTLQNHRGQQRIRTIEGYAKEVSEAEEKRFSEFLKPNDVKGTTLLYFDYDVKDDDTWLYLPALKKVKRILSTNKKDYFMGSDFTYEDMENIDLANWDFAIKGVEDKAGVSCHLIEATPNNDEEIKQTAYSKRLSWISRDDILPRRVEYYDKKGRLAKILTLEDIHPTSESDPRPRAHKLTMENLITKHTTILVLEKLELDVAVNDKVFSQRQLRQ